MIGIYKITSPSGKIYIGQSKDITKRWKKYENLKCKNQIKIYRSLLKYGVENHIFEIIEECEIHELNNKERYYQEFYNVIGNNGLNLLLTSTEEKCQILSEETIAKIKIASTGRKHSEETKNYLKLINSKENHPNFGRTFTNEHKQNLSKSRTGEKNCWFGKNLPEETREKMKQNHSRSKKVINTENGVIYRSCRLASEIENINYNTLYKYLCNDLPNLTNLVWYIENK